MSNLNGTAPKKTVNVARNLAGFAGQGTVAILGGVAVTPFMAGEVLCSMAGDMLMLLGKGILPRLGDAKGFHVSLLFHYWG